MQGGSETQESIRGTRSSFASPACRPTPLTIGVGAAFNIQKGTEAYALPSPARG